VEKAKAYVLKAATRTRLKDKINDIRNAESVLEIAYRWSSKNPYAPCNRYQQPLDKIFELDFSDDDIAPARCRAIALLAPTGAIQIAVLEIPQNHGRSGIPGQP
jgi:hypothetical protein